MEPPRPPGGGAPATPTTTPGGTTSPPPPLQDPFPAIKAVVERELEHLTALQAALFAGRPGAAAELPRAIAGLEEQLSALERAAASMVSDPARFGLSRGAAFHRQVEVENLRFQLGDVKRSVESVLQRAAAATTASSNSSAKQYTEIELGPPPGLNGGGGGRSPRGSPHRGAGGGGGYGASSSGRGALLGSPSRGNGGAGGGGGGRFGVAVGGDIEAHELDAHQSTVQQYMKTQDSDLDEISVRIGHIRRAGELMHEELSEQEALLSDLQESTDTTNLKLRGLRRRVADIIQRSKNDRQLTLVIVLSVVLVIMTFLAVA